MAWFDRLKEASYTSANGNSISFIYEDVSVEFDKKTTAFNFPDANGTYIQNLGNTSRRFPLRIFLSGSDYDFQANEFVNILSENGIGRLSHPLYGDFNVVPFGRIVRRDALKTAANQAVFDVTFWQTIDLIYPTSQTDPTSEVLNSLNSFVNQAASQFEEIVNVDTAALRSNLQVKYENVLTVTSNRLREIADFQDDTRSFFNTIERSINEGIDTLIQDPLTLAFQTIELVQTPGRSLTDVTARLEAYDGLLDIIIGNNPASEKVANNVNQANEFYNDELYASSYITGSVLSAVNNQFETKNDAIATADFLLNQLEKFTVWKDDNYTAIEQIDTGENYQSLQKTVALAAGFLVEISFNLKQENSIVLNRNRTIIDLSGELYGDIDKNLDFLINSNNLSGSEILQLPRGREIVYYV